MERSLAARRQALIAGFQKEIQRLVAHLPLVTKDEAKELKGMLMGVEERLARLEAKVL